MVESLSSGDSNDETKEGILKFIDERRESVKVNDIEGWISEACSLLERLNLSFSLEKGLEGLDLEGNVGSEPDVEGIENVREVLEKIDEEEAEVTVSSDISEKNP